MFGEHFKVVRWGTSKGERGRKSETWAAVDFTLKGRACACEKALGGEGEARAMGLEVEHRTRGVDERLNHRDRELECVRGFVLNECFWGEWLHLHSLLLWILTQLIRRGHTGLFSFYQPLSAQLLWSIIVEMPVRLSHLIHLCMCVSGIIYTHSWCVYGCDVWALLWPTQGKQTDRRNKMWRESCLSAHVLWQTASGGFKPACPSLL